MHWIENYYLLVFSLKYNQMHNDINNFHIQGDELFVDYGYDLNRCPGWYRNLHNELYSWFCTGFWYRNWDHQQRCTKAYTVQATGTETVQTFNAPTTVQKLVYRLLLKYSASTTVQMIVCRLGNICVNSNTIKLISEQTFVKKSFTVL